jgi:protein gp37
MKTSIEWTDRSTNPIYARDRETGRRGHLCQVVSRECAGCYAQGWQKGLGTRRPYTRSSLELVDLGFDEGALAEVLRRRTPTKWFWCDMTDLFFEPHPDAWIDRCFEVMEQTPHHVHQVLTKRPERMVRYLAQRYPGGVPAQIWCGVSCGTRKDGLPRLDLLRQVNAAVRFVSFEPLLEDLGRVNLDGIHWALIGGESSQRGHRANPCDLSWIRSLLAQCERAGVKPFVKQLGDHAVEDGKRVKAGRKGGDMALWPEDLRVRKIPREEE